MAGLIIGIIIAVLLFMIIGMYNSLVSLRNNVKQSWSGIDVQLKLRSDLIPNLIKTVKGYVKHEKELLTKLTKARTSLMGASDSQDIKKAAQSDGVIRSTLKSLFAVAENYPDLKANQNFIKFQDELAEIEKQIAAARRIYNENVTIYNTKIEVVPSNIVASMFSFKHFDLFKASAAERKAIEVSFE